MNEAERGLAGKALKAKREFGACAFNATEPWTDSVHTESLYRFRPDDRRFHDSIISRISRAFSDSFGFRFRAGISFLGWNTSIFFWGEFWKWIPKRTLSSRLRIVIEFKVQIEIFVCFIIERFQQHLFHDWYLFIFLFNIYISNIFCKRTITYNKIYSFS